MAPSNELLSEYKRGGVSWKDYCARYLDEMKQSVKDNPDKWDKMLMQRRVTFVCFETDPRNCHRSILANFVAERAKALGRHVKMDIQ